MKQKDCPHCFCIIPSNWFKDDGSFTCPRCLAVVYSISKHLGVDYPVYDRSDAHSWPDGEFHVRYDVDQLCVVAVRGRGELTEGFDKRRR